MALIENDRIAESDISYISADLGRFKANFREKIGLEISPLAEATTEFQLMVGEELTELADRIEVLVDQLQMMIVELRKRERLRLDQAEAIQLAFTASALQEEVDSLIALLANIEAELNKGDTAPGSSFQQSARAALHTRTTLRRIFKPIIKRIAQRLWRLISGLVTPKEWSIGGEVGNTVWGLTKVKLDVKFGPGQGRRGRLAESVSAGSRAPEFA